MGMLAGVAYEAGLRTGRSGAYAAYAFVLLWYLPYEDPVQGRVQCYLYIV